MSALLGAVSASSAGHSVSGVVRLCVCAVVRVVRVYQTVFAPCCEVTRGHEHNRKQACRCTAAMVGMEPPRTTFRRLSQVTPEAVAALLGWDVSGTHSNGTTPSRPDASANGAAAAPSSRARKRVAVAKAVAPFDGTPVGEGSDESDSSYSAGNSSDDGGSGSDGGDSDDSGGS